MFKLLLATILVSCAAGCATDRPYNPVATATSETFLLNDALKNVQPGMTQQHIRELTGQQLVIGYDYGSALKGDQGAAAISIPNPYRSREIETAQGKCTVEYYVTAVHNPDGKVSEDELLPLTFCNGVLAAKGADQVK